MREKYDDIIDLPHPNPRNHIRMKVSSRAAQFAPFAALTGHSEAIMEFARLTDEKIELDESMKSSINKKILLLQSKLKEKPLVTITFFCLDKKKAGGTYVSSTGHINKILDYEHVIIMSNNSVIHMDNISRIQLY